MVNIKQFTSILLLNGMIVALRVIFNLFRSNGLLRASFSVHSTRILISSSCISSKSVIPLTVPDITASFDWVLKVTSANYKDKISQYQQIGFGYSIWCCKIDNCSTLQKQSFGGAPYKKCSQATDKICRKTPVSESFFKLCFRPEVLTQMLSCEFWEIFKTTFFIWHLWWLFL